MIHDVVLIAGPTASGKSQVALAIAESLGGHIVNADAMQIYRELRVLTARPSDAEMKRVPHHLYGHVSVREAYSVGRYLVDAAQELEKIGKSRRTAIFAGGTGLYFAALTDGLAEIPSIPLSVRAEVRAKFSDIPSAAIHVELAKRDPDMAALLRPSDKQRLLRALEVVEATGKSLSYWQGRGGRPVLDGMRVTKFVLDVPREILRQRIDARFRTMMDSGAVDEAAALEQLDASLPASKTLGLRELLALRRGEISQEVAVARAVVRTGQYVKRQITWSRRRMADWLWIRQSAPDKIIAEILRHIA